MAGTCASFPFFTLPVELRYRVLLQSDLVTPCRYFEYSGGKFSAAHGPQTEEPREERLRRESEDADGNTVPQILNHDADWARGWRPPDALFSVSRAFAALAQSVLLSENHAEASGGGLSEEEYECLAEKDDEKAWEEALRRDAATCQAAMLVSGASRYEFLASLRSLEISFPRSYGDGSAPSGAVMQWREAAQRFRKTLNPRRLIMHIKGDGSIPVLQTVFGTHPLVFRTENLESNSILDQVRQSVDMYWPLDRLARLDGVRMFLWDVDKGVEGSKLVYYCRHLSEELPRMAGDMDLCEPLPSPIFHTQRQCQSLDGDSAETESGGQGDKQTTAWVEGIFARPGDEDERWINYYKELEDRR